MTAKTLGRYCDAESQIKSVIDGLQDGSPMKLPPLRYRPTCDGADWLNALADRPECVHTGKCRYQVTGRELKKELK